jgi:hypothetical protein
LALIQKQEEENRKSYYVLRKRSAQESYVPISYIDNEGHFRGAAVFDDLSTADFLNCYHKFSWHNGGNDACDCHHMQNQGFGVSH